MTLAGPVAHRVVLHYAAARYCEPSAVVLEGFPGRAAVSIGGVIVGEIVAREGTVSALGFVEHWDVRLDPAIVHEPVQHLGRAIGAVADQALGIQVELL